MEPVTTALAGIALVKKSVDFIKENIQTCQDIGQLIGHVENAMIGEQQIIKDRDKKGADPFATENVETVDFCPKGHRRLDTNENASHQRDLLPYYSSLGQ